MRKLLFCFLFLAVLACLPRTAHAAACGAPGISPATGTVTGVQSVTMSDGTSCSGGYICYTTDGSSPVSTSGTSCTTGTHYTGAISANITTTFKATESSASRTNSSTTTSTVTIKLNTPDDVGSSSNNDITATFTDTGWTGPSVVYCRTTGTAGSPPSDPTATTAGTCDGGSTSGGSASVTATNTVIKTIATRVGNVNSAVRTNTTFVLTVGATTCTPTSGLVPQSVSCSIATTTGGTIKYCDTSGSCDPSAGSTWSNTTISVPGYLRVVGTKTNYANSSVNTYQYTSPGSDRGVLIF